MMFSVMSVLFYVSSASNETFPFYASSPASVAFCFFDRSYSTCTVVTQHYNFDLHFSDKLTMLDISSRPSWSCVCLIFRNVRSYHLPIFQLNYVGLGIWLS